MASFVRLDLKPRLGPRNPIAAAGDLAWYPVDAVPEGWMVLNAGWLDQTAYPELFRAIGFRFGRNDKGQFRIPAFSDFVRVHNGEATGDNAKRVAFSHENDEIRLHGHGGGSTTSAGGHTHQMTVRGSRAVYPWNNARSPNGGQASPGMYGVQSMNTSGSGGHTHSANAAQVGAAETAPDHVVYRLCLCLGLDSDLLFFPPLGFVDPDASGTAPPPPSRADYSTFVKWLATRTYRALRVTERGRWSGASDEGYLPSNINRQDVLDRWWIYTMEYSPPTNREGIMIGTPYAVPNVLNSGRVAYDAALGLVMYHLVPSRAIGDEIIANKRQVGMRFLAYESLYDGLPVVTRNGVTSFGYQSGQLINTCPVYEFVYWDEAAGRAMRLLNPHRPNAVPTELVMSATYADFVTFLNTRFGATRSGVGEIIGERVIRGAYSVGSGQGVLATDSRGVRFDTVLEQLIRLPGVPQAIRDDYFANRRTFGVEFGKNYVNGDYQYIEVTGLYFWDAAAQVGMQVFNPLVPIYT